MRISDWSSDVCSSDLPDRQRAARRRGGNRPIPIFVVAGDRVVEPERAVGVADMPLERDWRRRDAEFGLAVEIEIIVAAGGEIEALLTAPGIIGAQLRRHRPDSAAERGVGTECGRTCSSWWSPYP